MQPVNNSVISEIFVSYAREDKGFVRRLNEELSKQSRNVWVDFDDILPAAEFMKAIYLAIEASDTVIFVLSPDSIVSKVCAEEIAHAVGCNKRLVPVVCRDVKDDDVVPALRALNWIFFRRAMTSGKPSKSWRPLSTRILTGCGRIRGCWSVLLSGTRWNEITVSCFAGMIQVERAITQATESKYPQLNHVQREFILASRQEERRNQVGVAQRLAAQAKVVLEADSHRGLLLAVEAMRVASKAKAGEPQIRAIEETLRRALGYCGGCRILGHGHDGWVRALGFTPDGNRLITVGNDARLWDLTAPNPATTALVLPGHELGVLAIAISPNGRWLATAGEQVHLWDLTAENLATTSIVLSSDGEGSILALAISPDNRWLVAGTSKKALLWNLTALDPAAIPLLSEDTEISAVAFSPDNRWLAIGGWNNARIWDLTVQDLPTLGTILPEQFASSPLVFSPDGRWLVTNSSLWDLTVPDRTATPIVLSGHGEMITDVAISRDSRWLLIGSADNTASLWDLTAPDPSAKSIVLRGHRDNVHAVAIGPTNHWLVTGSDDETACLWDLTAQDPPASPIVLRGHEAEVTAVAVSPDDRWLVTGSNDSTARLWPLKLGDFLDFARLVAVRNLSLQEWEQYFPGQSYRKTFPDLPGPENEH